MVGILCALISVISFSCLVVVLKKHIVFVGSESVMLTALYLLPTVALLPFVHFSEIAHLSLWQFLVIAAIASSWSLAEFLHLRSLRVIDPSACQILSSLRFVVVMAMSFWLLESTSSFIKWGGLSLIVATVVIYAFISKVSLQAIVVGSLRSVVMGGAIMLEKTMGDACSPITLSFLILLCALSIYFVSSLGHRHEYKKLCAERPHVILMVALFSALNEGCWYTALIIGDILVVNAIAMTTVLSVLIAEMIYLKTPLPDYQKGVCYISLVVGGMIGTM